MKSADYKRAEDELQKISKDVSAMDERFHNDVKVICEDGSIFFYRDAFKVKLTAGWIGIVTEHYGDMLFHEDDLYECAEYRKVG